MSSIQVVFLFDLNACADFLFCSKEELNKSLLSVRLACLRLLSEFSTKYPNLKWGAKFYDSQGSKNQTMCKFLFADLSLENFETLENEICVRYDRHLSILRALLDSSQNNLLSINSIISEENNVSLPVKILQLALTQALCEFQWETMDMWSPSYNTKIKKQKKNFLFVFSNFKDNDESLHKCFGQNYSLSKSEFMDIFLPRSLRDSIMKKAGIHLVLLNMCEDQKFMGCSSSKFLSLLSDTLRSIHGSFIPLCILSQPLYNLKLLNDLERNICQEKELILSNLPTGYQNSFITFSALFEQSLYNSFYSNTNTSVYDCCIDFRNKNIKVPIVIMEILNRNPDLAEGTNGKASNSEKNKYAKYWSKFNVCSTVCRDTVFPTSKVLLCMSNTDESNSLYNCSLQKLNKLLSISACSLLLECVTEDGKKLPGLLNSLSCDSSVISVFDPSSPLKPNCKIPDCSSLKIQTFQRNFMDEIQNVLNEGTDLLDNMKTNPIIIPKPFKMQSLENKFKPQNISLAPATLNNSLKMKDYSNLLMKSVTKNKKSKLKQIKQSSDHESETNAADQSKIEDNMPDCVSEIKHLEELPLDISYEDLLLAIRNAYDSAIASEFVSAVTASQAIMKRLVNYYKKYNETSYEEQVSAMLKNNILMNDQRCITQKYETLDPKEAAEKIIKECQIQILLNLEIECLKLSPDKFGCISTITSLLRTAEFYFMYKEMLQLDGLKERNIFLNDVLKKSYGEKLHDILNECIQEFEDSESSPGSAADTISSEFNNEEELFSSVISSTLSEKSSSSVGSYKINNKDAKNKNTLERKLVRRRSDISDTVRYRQVLLPKSSPKKKKAKVAANKGVRYSPRLAAKRIEHNKSTSEKTNKARRNLFSGDKAFRTPKKNDKQLTPKGKKENFISKTKLAAETPTHKQNYSALQRRKSFMDQSNSPKVIAESPTIRKTAKDHSSKELLESLLISRKPSSTAIEHKKRLPRFNDFTPEGKRRLSLKLFSKIHISPTARQGIKKCTKRLFEQMSPQKNVESCKKFKTFNEVEEASNVYSKNETHS